MRNSALIEEITDEAIGGDTYCTACLEPCTEVVVHAEEMFPDPSAFDGVGFRSVPRMGSSCCEAEVRNDDDWLEDQRMNRGDA